MLAESIEFEQLDSDRVTLNNLLLTNDWRFKLGDGIGLMSVSGLSLATHLPKQSLNIKLMAGGKAVRLVIPYSDAAQVMATAFEPVDLRALPEFLLQAAMERFIAQYQSSISQLFSAEIELLSVQISNDDIESELVEQELCLQAQIELFGKVFQAFVVVEQDVCIPFLRQNLQQKRQPSPSMDLKVQFSFGYLSLPMLEIGALSSGDVLFFDVCYFANQNRQCLMIENRPAWLVERRMNGFTVISPWSETMNQQVIMNDVDVESAIDTDTIEVNVNFQMPDQQMSLKEIQALAPGYVFDLQAEPSKAVQVTVNGRGLGYGELVSVGGKLGVRLTSIIDG